MIEIKEEYIKQAQNIFIDGNSFDEFERVPFINNLGNCDLLAVPGSGKTTALMAKLYCIAQNMPFKDGSGILVLAHTNQAIEEIEKNLRRDCPKLFEYPNFVGTIQSFTNRFLANQACFEKYGSFIKKNDDDIPSNNLISLSKKLPFKNFLFSNFFNQIYSREAVVSINLLMNGLNITRKEAREILKNLRSFEVISKLNSLIYKNFKDVNTHTQITDALKSLLTGIHEKALSYVNSEKHSRGLIYRLDFIKEKFIYENTSLGFNTESGKILLDLYEQLFKEGSLRYKDSFSFAEWYISKYPEIKKILQLRFKYVFIDEMQDLEKFQIDLIDDIFFSPDSRTVIQRIGDINQSIYSSGKRVKGNCDWIPRSQIYFTGSNRLTQEIANCVNYYTLDPQLDDNGNKRFVVKGLSKIDNPIKPYLLIFNRDSKDKLKMKFEELIKKHGLHNTLSGKKYGFHIIGWSTEWNDEEQNRNNEKIRLKDIFPNYSREIKHKKEDFDCLRKHLQLYDRDKKTLEGIRKSILNALIRILREEKIYKNESRKTYFRKRDLIDFMKGLGEDKYKDFKLKLFSWCFRIVAKNDYEAIYIEIKQYIENEFINYDWCNNTTSTTRKISSATVFLNGIYELVSDEKEDEELMVDTIKIQTSSVHAVKGQTHCATMYIESSYYNYETEKLSVTIKGTKGNPDVILPNPLYNENHNYRKDDDARAKEALKMMYVGFSRPTHLLCFAVLEENVKDNIDKYKNAGWMILNI